MHRLGHASGVARSLGASRLEAALGERDQLGCGRACIQPLVGTAQLRPGCLLEPGGRVAQVGRLAGQDLAEDRTERKDVGPLVEVIDVAQRLLGRHVGRRPHHGAHERRRAFGVRPRRRDPRVVDAGIRRLPLVDRAPASEHLGESPVEDLHLAERADHHVRRLQVPVDDTARVGVGDRLTQLLEDLEQATRRALRVTRIQELAREGLALHELHGEERPRAVLESELVDGHDTGVLELTADLGFVDEALEHVPIAFELAAEDLQRDVPAEVHVAPLQDLADAALGDGSEDLVASRAPQHRLRRGGLASHPQLDARRRLPRLLHQLEDALLVGVHGYFSSTGAL